MICILYIKDSSCSVKERNHIIGSLFFLFVTSPFVVEPWFSISEE